MPIFGLVINLIYFGLFETGSTHLLQMSAFMRMVESKEIDDTFHK